MQSYKMYKVGVFKCGESVHFRHYSLNKIPKYVKGVFCLKVNSGYLI